MELAVRLQEAEIIPTVIDAFTPLLTLSVAWENATAQVGNIIEPSELQDAPSVQFVDQAPPDAGLSNRSKSSSVQLTVAMTDPDAPSRDDPKWSEICHWIATSVHLTDPDHKLSGVRTEVKEIMPYKPPGPPPKTGKHRYVLVALAPKNGTTEKLSLSKPGDRQHWGYGKKEMGLRKWAEENGLEVIGKLLCFCWLCTNVFG